MTWVFIDPKWERSCDGCGNLLPYEGATRTYASIARVDRVEVGRSISAPVTDQRHFDDAARRTDGQRHFCCATPECAAASLAVIHALRVEEALGS